MLTRAIKLLQVPLPASTANCKKFTTLQSYNPIKHIKQLNSSPYPVGTSAAKRKLTCTTRATYLPRSFSMATEQISLKHIPAKSLHVSTPTWWLESRFHFSFAEYYNPQNAEFGVLRVLNDDLVQPHAGFGTHGHRDMEILTYIVDGQLTHKDSMGTAETLGRGAVQYMSAGRGVTHSEMNNGDKLLRFLQIWIKPDNRGYTPNYGSRVFSKEARHNKFQHLVTSFSALGDVADSGSGIIPIHQDANLFVSEMDPGVELQMEMKKHRQAYLVCIEGGVEANGKALAARDAMEIRPADSSVLKVKADAQQGGHVLLIEMAKA